MVNRPVAYVEFEADSSGNYEDGRPVVIEILGGMAMRADYLYMNELLWKAGGPDLPLHKQEYFELALEDPPNFWGDCYVVHRTRFEWDEVKRQMVPADHIIDRASTLEVAMARYAMHRQILADEGFVCSDLDPIL